MSSEKSLDNSEAKAPIEVEDKYVPKLSDKFLQKITQLNLPDDKIRFCLDQMSHSLSQEKTPGFKEFWEIRKYCLPLFKESIPAYVRSSLWKEFIDLTAEARRLKDILDEQASFTIEQIDLAISGLEKEIFEYEDLIEKSPKVKFFRDSKSLSNALEELCTLQHEVGILSIVIQRVSSLRKELIATEMRIRFKNKFFKRLNGIGDFLFPKRKELIHKLSSIFLEAVQKFYDNHFKGEIVEAQFYVLKDEIKSIQAVSKELTLSNKAFIEARNLLSLCWDKVKELESIKKNEIKEKKEIFDENKIKVIEKIDEIAKKIEEYSYERLNVEISEILKFMRSIELGREEIKELKERLRNIKVPFEEKKKREEERRIEQKKEAIEKRRKELIDLKSDISKAYEMLEDPERVNKTIVAIEKRAAALILTKYEKQILERELKPLKDCYANLKEKALLAALSDDELKSLEKLKNVLNERKARKKTIKDQLEIYRKELGGSGFDFEKAIMLRELIDAEKLRLGKAEEGILEIDEKIAEIEGR